MLRSGNIASAARRALATTAPATMMLTVLAFPAGRLAADTVHLKTGGVIENCRIVKHDEASVYLRSPSGPMTVPRGEVQSVTRARSVFDAFDDYRKTLADGDVAGRYRLASWCLETGGLRPEVNELLEEVVALDPNHAQARRLLGYVAVNGTWRRLKPIVLHLEVMQGEEMAADFSQQLTVAIQARDDVQLSDRPIETGGSRSCALQVWLSTYTAQGTTFYGRELRGAQGRAVVALAASSEWIGNRPYTLKVEGEAPLTAPDAQQKALIDALTRNSTEVHRLLDQLTQARIASVEARVREAAKPEEDGAAESAAKPAGKSSRGTAKGAVDARA